MTEYDSVQSQKDMFKYEISQLKKFKEESDLMMSKKVKAGAKL